MQTEKKKVDWHLPSIGKQEDPAPTANDLKQLQQQCRVAEMVKTSFRKQCEHRILSQQKKIYQLKEQQKELKLTVLFNGSQKNLQKHQENAKKLVELTEAQDKYNHLIEEKKNLISDLEVKIKEKEEEIVKHKRVMSKAKTVARSKIDHLENELQHVTQKYNVMKSENEKLKEHINHLRFKKKNFQSVIDEMQQKITRQKVSIEKIQEQIVSAHKEKTDIQTETLTFKDIADKTLKKYDIKIEDLSRYVDHLNKQKQFMEAKLQDRSSMARELQQKRQEQRLEKRRKYNQEITDNYNSICEGLGNLFGQEDVDLAEMAKQYSFNDMKNYSLFTYVNVLDSDVEMIKQEIKATEDEIFNMESQNENLLNEQLISQKQLEEELQKTSEATEKYKNKYMEMTRDFERITSATEDLVKNLDCDLSSIKKNLWFKKLTCHEKLKYFRILEMKMDDLIQILNFCALRDMTEDNFSSISIDPILDASDVSVVHKKISLPSMPKVIKPTDDSAMWAHMNMGPTQMPSSANCTLTVVEVLSLAELRKKVLRDMSSRQKKAKRKRQRNMV